MCCFLAVISRDPFRASEAAAAPKLNTNAGVLSSGLSRQITFIKRAYTFCGMFSLGETVEFLLGNPFSTPVGQRIGKSLLLKVFKRGFLAVGFILTSFNSNTCSIS